MHLPGFNQISRIVGLLEVIEVLITSTGLGQRSWWEVARVKSKYSFVLFDADIGKTLESPVHVSLPLRSLGRLSCRVAWGQEFCFISFNEQEKTCENEAKYV